MTGDTLWFLVLALGLLAVLYLVVAELVARSFRLQDDGRTECVTVELDTPGHHIALYHHPPDTRRYAEPVILCHGLGANRYNMDFFDDGLGQDRLSLARALVLAGFDVWVLETRGHGRATVPRGASWTIDDEVNEDVPAAIETVLDLTGAKKVLWVGHSWGGILQYFFFGTQHPLTKRIAGLVTVGSPGTVRYVKGLRYTHAPGWLLSRLLRRPVPLAWLARLGVPIVGGLNLFPKLFLSKLAPLDAPLLRRLFASLAEDIPAGILRQCIEWARRGEMCSADGTPLEEGLPHLDVPSLFVAGSMDAIAPPLSVKFVADRVSSKDVQYVVMGKERGCDVEYGHGGLLLARHAPDEVFPVIERWLVRHATSEITAIWSHSAPPNGKPNGHV